MYSQPKSNRRWLFFPISMLFHGLLIAAIVAVPLMMADSKLPEVKITKVFLTAAPPQPPRFPKEEAEDTRTLKNRSPKKKNPNPNNPY